MRGRRASDGDILVGQGVDPDRLAEIYDLEHEEVAVDVAFYRDLSRRARGAVLDLGCGSGRLFRAVIDGGATELVGVDGSAALLRRAEARIGADPRLRRARADGRLSLECADARRYATSRHFALVMAVGLLPHLEGPQEARAVLARAAELVEPAGLTVIEVLGPGALPTRDLPPSEDWRRELPDGRRVVRRSRLQRRPTPEGLRVEFSTLSDVEYPDGTIARLPARFRLWYPSPGALIRLVEEAGFVIEAAYGSHDLEALGAASERCILVGRRPAREGEIDPVSVARGARSDEWQASRSVF
jgi:SAM-dependent methyltransferase